MAAMQPSERPWNLLASLAAMLEDPALAREAAQGWERDQRTSTADSLGSRAYFRSQVAMAERRWNDAIPALREADARFAMSVHYAAMQLGRAHDAAGHPDSAITHLERLVSTPISDWWDGSAWQPQSHLRLGALYEAQGNLTKAADHYARFVELWENADAELQPMVQEARRRLAALKAKTG